MPDHDDELTPVDELTASLGKWGTRIGLAAVVSGAVVGGIARHWPTFIVGVFGIFAFIFNRALYRFIERRQTRK